MGWGMTSATEAVQQVWEYHVERLDGSLSPVDLGERLTEFGSEGWELVGYDCSELGITFFFKRPAITKSKGTAKFAVG